MYSFFPFHRGERDLKMSISSKSLMNNHCHQLGCLLRPVLVGENLELVTSYHPAYQLRCWNEARSSDVYPDFCSPVVLPAPLGQWVEFYGGLRYEVHIFALHNDLHHSSFIDVGVKSAIPGWVHSWLLLDIHLSIF